jgi:hypothetical protein
MFHSSAPFPCPETPTQRISSSKVTTEKGQQAQQAPLTVGLLQHKLSKVRAMLGGQSTVTHLMFETWHVRTAPMLPSFLLSVGQPGIS